MSLHFEKIRIKEVRKETADCVSVLFDIPPHLQDAFSYQAGQHIGIRTTINGSELRRSYSLCSTPLQNEWRVAIKKVPGGQFSTYANEALAAGAELELMKPMGHFGTIYNPTQKKKYIAIAAGSGITPVISILKTILQTEPQSHCTLVYGNRNRASIIFKEELEALKNKYLQRFSLIHILSREGTDAAINHGRIDAAKCQQLFNKAIPLHADEYFICGPEEMIFTVKDFLANSGVEKSQIHFELFSTAAVQPLQQAAKVSTDAIERNSTVSIKLDGISFNVGVPFYGTSILDAALAGGADLPYSCKGGVCCTCKARLLAGEVSMDVSYGLEAEEIEKGFILACQAHPKTENVVIDFDIK